MKSLGIIVFLLLLAGIAVFFVLRDNSSPKLALQPDVRAATAQNPPVLVLEDKGSGLKSVEIEVTQEGKVTRLPDTTFREGTSKQSLRLPLEKAGLKEGPFLMNIKVKDHSFPSNSTKKELAMVYDVRPPTISILTTAHNINQGGTALVMFRVSEKVRKAGVQVANHFFPAYLQPGDVYACLFAFTYDLQPTDFLPKVVVEDLAGNQRAGSFYYRVKLKPVRTDRIEVSPGFLAEKMPEFQHYFPQVTDPLELFLRVNRELRASNIATLKEVAVKTSNTPVWQGAFLRLPNAAPRAGFNEARDYINQGQKVDHQVHLGLDLASLAASQVPASNSGTVVFAGELGIYGQCVIIDHGLGLQSLYSHLSAISVKVGDKVEKGRIIGRTGSTGMAGGDHLHFGIVLAGMEVDPIEWLDPHWIKDNFTDKWNNAIGQTAAQK